MELTPAAVVDVWLTPPRFPSPKIDLPDARRVLSLRPAPLPVFVHASSPEALGVGRALEAAVWGESEKRALLVHGWGGEARQLGAWIGPLLGAGYEVWAGDAVGHGRSEGTLSCAPASAALLVALAELAGTPFDLVVAHSLGALAATLALGEGLLARRIVFLAPCCYVLDDLLAVARKLDWPPSRDTELLDWFARNFAPASAPRLDLIGALERVAAPPPLQIFHDPKDESVPIDEARLIASRWPGATLHETPRVGHSRILFARKVIEAAISGPGAVQ